ncbi:zinc-ribbon domain-containing protein [Thermophilibacter sp.]
MFCPNCGNQLPDGSRFCPSCGAAVGATEPAAGGPATPAPTPTPATPFDASTPGTALATPAPAPSMRWYKFIIWFQLFASALINAANAIMLFGGLHYQGASRYVYALFDGLQAVDIVFGILYVALIVAAVVVRQELAKFRRDAPLHYLIVVGVNGVSGLAYLLATSAVTHIDLSLLSDVQPFSQLVGAVILVACSKVYFDRRAHLFVN